VRKEFVQKIKLNEKAQANTQDKIKALEELQKETHASFASQKELLQSRIQVAERDLQAHQYLLEKNNVSRQEVIKKELNVKSLHTQLQNLELQIEQQTAKYHEELAELKLALQRFQAELSHFNEKAFIHIRIKGKIQDIKCTQSNGEIKIKLFIETSGKKVAGEGGKKILLYKVPLFHNLEPMLLEACWRNWGSCSIEIFRRAAPKIGFHAPGKTGSSYGQD